MEAIHLKLAEPNHGHRHHMGDGRALQNVLSTIAVENASNPPVPGVAAKSPESLATAGGKLHALAAQPRHLALTYPPRRTRVTQRAGVWESQ